MLASVKRQGAGGHTCYLAWGDVNSYILAVLAVLAVLALRGSPKPRVLPVKPTGPLHGAVKRHVWDGKVGRTLDPAAARAGP